MGRRLRTVRHARAGEASRAPAGLREDQKALCGELAKAQMLEEPRLELSNVERGHGSLPREA